MSPLALAYPFIAALAWRMGGIGEEGSPWKRVFKACSFALFALPLLWLYFDHTGSIINTALLAAALLPGIIIRRQIADSEDFPHRLPINLEADQFISFDWLIGKWRTRAEAAKADFPLRQSYKTLSFALNKVAIATPLYGLLAAFSLTLYPLINALLNLAFGPIYRFCYNLCDYDRRITFMAGHTMAELTIGFYLGLIDIILFEHVLKEVIWRF